MIRLTNGNTVVGSGRIYGAASTSAMSAGWYGTLPTSATNTATQNYYGNAEATGSSGASDGSGGSSAAASRAIANYTGPKTDPQIDTFCKNAYINKCLDQATGTSTYASQTTTVCQILGTMTPGGQSASAYCKYC